ncbi:MAG: hypothetical protein Salg2KO_15360 [Salibacteraceae bacterium]
MRILAIFEAKQNLIMKLGVLIILFSLCFSLVQAQAPSACGTMLESIEGAPLEELGKEFKRLDAYSNPYCDTTNSDYHKLMIEIANQITSMHGGEAQILSALGEPYFKGPLSEYENQKVTVGRGGKPIGKSLPPQFKIPSGDYYIVYFWRNKDYLTFALKDGACTGHTWWEKGNYR